MRVQAAGLTDVGKTRRNNEDSFRVDEALGLLLVADGMGGHAAGEVASALAADVIPQQMAARTAAEGEFPAHWSPEARSLAAAVRLANEAIYRAAQGRPERRGMGTTVVAAWVRGSRAVIAHVGDSRAYLYRRGRLVQWTADHSLVAEQVARGLLTPAEAESAENQNILTRALGAGESVEVDVQERRLQPGDVLLLCTDGLTRMASTGEMERALEGLSDPVKMCQNLIALALERGGRDNVTAVAARVVPVGLWERVTSVWNGRRPLAPAR